MVLGGGLGIVSHVEPWINGCLLAFCRLFGHLARGAHKVVERRDGSVMDC